ncbi:MAG TPA: cupin domain-containing protein, partial [Thermomicrobiales bacterium]|nr:cupin domain-containing protein [Thermomicrobiales bacterium]
MRNPAHFGTSHLLRAGQSALLVTTLAGSLMLSPAVMAQDATPASSPVASPVATAEAASTTLMSARFDEFVPAPMTVRMLRITVEPGASTPMHTHPGPEFDLIESGTLAIRTEGEATITRANGDKEAATAEEQSLGEGDWILYPAGTGMYYENTSDSPVVLLSAVLLPVGTDYPESITYTDGQPTSKDFEGVSFKVLGDGLVQHMPKGGATVTISSIDMPAGAALPAADGVAMYSQVKGNFSFTVDSGAVQVSRSKLQSLQSNAVAGEEF